MSAIGEAARRQGELVYAWQAPGGGAGPGEAACAALCLKWIRLRLNGGDLLYDVTTRLAVPDDGRPAAPLLRDLGYAPALVELGLERGAPVVFAGRPDPALIAGHLAGAAPGCYLVQYRRTEGHAGELAALHLEPKGIHYFDPRFGHFVFKDQSRFLNWYQSFLAASGYAARIETALTPMAWSQGHMLAKLRKRFGA